MSYFGRPVASIWCVLTSWFILLCQALGGHSQHLGSKWTGRAEVCLKGADHIVRTKLGTHGSEWIWCAWVCLKGAGDMMIT